MTMDDPGFGDHSVEILDGAEGPELVIDGVPVLIRPYGDLFILDEDAFGPPADLEELARRFLIAEDVDRYRRHHGLAGSGEV